MSPATFAGGLAMLAVLAVWRCRRSLPRLRYAPQRLKSILRLGLARPVIVFLGALVGWLAVMEPLIASTRPGYLHGSATSWYYHWLTERTMSYGGFPPTSLEWGGVHPFQLVYTAMTAHGAVTASLAGGTTLMLLDYYRLAVAALTLLAAYALWRRFMPAWWAWLAAVLTMSSTLVSGKSGDYRPETFGFLLVLWSGWLLDEAYARRSVRWAALAGLVSATAFLAHGVAWSITPPLWLGITLSRLLPYLFSRTAIALPKPAGAAADLRSNAPKMLRIVGACALAFFISLTGLAYGSGGGAEFSHLARLTGATGSVERQPATAPGMEGRDQTWVLQEAAFSAKYIKQIEKEPPGYLTELLADPFQEPPPTIEPYPGVEYAVPSTIALFALGFLAVLGSLPFLPPRSRRGVLTAVVFAVGIFALTYLMVSVYSTYVPQRTSWRRIRPYSVVALAGLLAFLGWALSSYLYRALRRMFRGHRLRRGRLQQRALAAVSVSLVTAVLVASFTPMAGSKTSAAARGSHHEKSTKPTAARVSHHGKKSQGRGLSPQAYDAYAWMKHNLPPHSHVLANAYTQGTIGLLTGDNGILDGRIPFREPWMNQAIRQLLEARRFYVYPTGSKLPANPDYVLVAQGTNLGTAKTFPADVWALNHDPRLKLIKNFKGSGTLLLFKVVKGQK